MSALLLSLPSVAANVQPTLELSFNDATITSFSTCESSTASAVLISPGTGEFQWLLEARRVNVNWTEKVRTEIGRPPSFNDTYYRNTKSDNQDEEQFSDVTANATSRGSRSTFAMVDASASTGLQFSEATTRVVPAGSPMWTPMTDEPDLVKPVKLPDGMIESSTIDGQFVIAGNFSVYLWETIIVVNSPTGTKEFRSGNWSQALGPAVGSDSAVRDRYYRNIRIDVEDGILVLTTVDRQATWRAGSASFRGNLIVDLEGAKRENVGGEQETPDQRADLSVRGDGHFDVQNQTESRGRLGGAFTLQDGQLRGPVTVPLAEPSGQIVQPPNIPNQGTNNGWWWLFSLLLIPLVAFGVVRYDLPRPDVTDVEWAVLTNRPRRARRWARRVVRREPGNPDAVFLYASTLLQAERFEQALDDVEPLAEKIAVSSRVGVAFTLAVAAKMTGDKVRMDRWAREAAREPELRQRLIDGKVWADTKRMRLDETSPAAYV